MFFEEKEVSVDWLFGGEATSGDYCVVPSFEILSQEIEFNDEVVKVPAITIAETKLHCIKNNGKHCELLFDNALFQMSIAPFKAGKEVCFKNSFLKKYLKTVFVEYFKKTMKLSEDFKIKCNLLTSSEVFGEDCIPWFSEQKHKIAMYGDHTAWWWLGDRYSDNDDDDASSASSFWFAFVGGLGESGISGASSAGGYVRPRFVIGAKA